MNGLEWLSRLDGTIWLITFIAAVLAALFSCVINDLLR